MSDGPARLEVLYNGACPICAREIAHYRRRAAVTGAPLAFTDIAASPEAARQHGLEPRTAYRRIHAVTGEGRLLGGVDAFAALWERLPGWGALARAVRHPLLRPLAHSLYERILAPALFVLHERRERRRAALAKPAADR